MWYWFEPRPVTCSVMNRLQVCTVQLLFQCQIRVLCMVCSPWSATRPYNTKHWTQFHEVHLRHAVSSPSRRHLKQWGRTSLLDMPLEHVHGHESGGGWRSCLARTASRNFDWKSTVCVTCEHETVTDEDEATCSDCGLGKYQDLSGISKWRLRSKVQRGLSTKWVSRTTMPSGVVCMGPQVMLSVYCPGVAACMQACAGVVDQKKWNIGRRESGTRRWEPNRNFVSHFQSRSPMVSFSTIDKFW